MSSNSNTIDRAALEATLVDQGKRAGQGRDSQVRALIALVETAYHGKIDLVKDKHASGVDDATWAAEIYVKAQTGHSQFDAKAPNQRKLCSTFRSCISLGGWTGGGVGEPLGRMYDLLGFRTAMMAKRGAKVDDAANTLLKFARLQVKRTTLLSDDELKALCLRKTTDLKSSEEIVSGIRKQLLSLQKGKAANGTAQDDSAEVTQAVKSLTKRLEDIAAAKRTPAVEEWGDATLTEDQAAEMLRREEAELTEIEAAAKRTVQEAELGDGEEIAEEYHGDPVVAAQESEYEARMLREGY